MIFTKLDQQVMDILCCPLCKRPIATSDSQPQSLLCRACSTTYSKVAVVHATHEEHTYDLRIARPSYCVPDGMRKWALTQKEYEISCHYGAGVHDSLATYLAEIDSVKEIYHVEFPKLTGVILDVGGYVGTLRHFLPPSGVALYLSVDPLLEAFRGIEFRPNLLKAYPSLVEPCNFLSCHAERLPFVGSAFDWVHMRSVLDHFEDPYLAMKEAYRVLKPGGTALIGLTVHGGRSPLKVPGEGSVGIARWSGVTARVTAKVRAGGITGLLKSGASRIRRGQLLRAKYDHTFHWKYEDLLDLLHVTNFSVMKEHWQKPPFDMCVYIMVRK
jgi:SAM-dependent methyltransferase